MKTPLLLLFTLFLAFSAAGQKPTDVLATATGHTFTASDLSPEAQKAVTNLPDAIGELRKKILSQQLGTMLLETEAKARGTTVEALLKEQTSKLPEPAADQIQAVYDANQSAFGGKQLVEVRKQIVDYLKREPTDKAIGSYVDSLAAKYKVTFGKDVNAVDLKPTDVLITMTGRSLADKEFEDAARLTIYNARASFYDDLSDDLQETIFNTLVTDEAKTVNISASELIAREVTSKMKDYTDAERIGLETSFRNRLFTKYAVKILLKEPTPVALNISIVGSPSRGPATAPVTVVMFSDFQCPACSATHPVLDKAVAQYPGRIHFVVRNYPLENIHEHAYRAALAAAAANLQGKFFEYTDILYTHQNALDDDSLKKYAAQLGLNAKQFELDFNSEKVAAVVKKDQAEGASYGVSGTPTIFVNGVMVRKLSEEGFKSAIDRALKK